MAIELAKVTNTPVLFTAADIPAEYDKPIKSADEPVVVEMKRTPILAIKPTGEEVQLAEVVTPPPAETLVAANTAPASTPPERTLPETSSTLPLIGLFGLLALGGAFAARTVAKHLR